MTRMPASQTEALAELADRAQRLTAHEKADLGIAWAAARHTAGAAAWGAARTAVWKAARATGRAGTAWGAAGAAAGAAAQGSARLAAWDAAWDAAWALGCRDLVGEGFTGEQYDLLTRAWRTVIGPLCPDDQTV